MIWADKSGILTFGSMQFCVMMVGGVVMGLVFFIDLFYFKSVC